MLSSFCPFLTGFLLSLLLFVAINILAAHLQSDCGLPAFFNMSGCADDIRRAGFPLQFYEEGGFAYRHNFNVPLFITDLMIGLAFSAAGGMAAARVWKQTR
jgi:hypothetical protein